MGVVRAAGGQDCETPEVRVRAARLNVPWTRERNVGREQLRHVSPLAPLVRGRKTPMLEGLVLCGELPALYVRSSKAGVNPAHTQFSSHGGFKGSGQIEASSVYGRLRGLNKVERKIAC